jgi:signal transduction histidine kinase
MVAAVFGLAAAAEAAVRVQGPILPVGVLVAVAAVAPLTLVRLWPAGAAFLSTAACLSAMVMSTPVTVAGMCTLAILFAAAGWRSRLRTAVLLVIPFAVYAVLVVSTDAVGGRAAAFAVLTITAGAAASGAVLRLREQTRQRRAREQSAAASQSEYAARGERARIARELHDVVAHHITMIALQAEAARVATPGLPEEGARRLTAIGDTARTALTEMRRLLGVLRADMDTDQELRHPQPGLGQLNALLDEVREAGSASVRLIVSGQVEPLDHSIELTAYRIVQEALTNARRHAPSASVDVELCYGDGQLRVRIQDNGPGPAHGDGGAGQAGTPGHGLSGMRERAAMAGGRLSAGPGNSTGFLVEAVLPAKGAAA